MQSGTISDYLADRGYGFIKPDDGGGDMFFHIKAFQFGQLPKAGMRVSFDVQPDSGPRATPRR
jgi:CspA family cold shock protein